jgi:hypothetical protein
VNVPPSGVGISPTLLSQNHASLTVSGLAPIDIQ